MSGRGRQGVQRDHWPRFNRRLWQSNDYEHLIRDNRGLETIRIYIQSKPAFRLQDQLHPDRPSSW